MDRSVPSGDAPLDFRREVSRYADQLSEHIRTLRQSPTPKMDDHFSRLAISRLEASEEELRVAMEEMSIQAAQLEEVVAHLEAEQTRFRTAFDLTPSPLLITDAKGMIREANRSAASFFGRPPGRLEGKPLAGLVAREDRKALRSNLNRLGRLEALEVERISLAPRDGELVEVSVRMRSLPSTVPGVAHVLWAFQSVPEGDLPPADLPGADSPGADSPGAVVSGGEQARFLVRAMAEMHGHLDVPAVAEVACRLAAERFGRWSRVDVLRPDGRLHLVASATMDAGDPELPRRVLDPESPHVRAVLDAGASRWIGEDRAPDEVLTQGDEGRMPGEARLLLPILDRERPLGVLSVGMPRGEADDEDPFLLMRAFAGAVGRAVANARQMEEVQEEIERTRVSSRGRSRALSGISHEFRTPLNAVMGYCDLLLDDVAAPLPEPCRRYVKSMRASSEHLAVLVNDILAFSEEEKGLLIRKETRLRPLVQQVGSIVEELAGARGLELRIELPPEDLTLRTDAGRLRQILLNLLDNAVKYSIEGRVGLEIEPGETHVVFRVHDTGPGISPDELPHIFDAYWRGGSAEVTNRKGSGIGLAVVKQLVERLQGAIDVESEVGSGTTFFLTFPR